MDKTLTDQEIQAEQYLLSVSLLMTLFKLFAKYKLETIPDSPSWRVTLPRKSCLFCTLQSDLTLFYIHKEKSNAGPCTYNYWLQAHNGTGFTEFWRRKEADQFFKIDKYDCFELLYELIQLYDNGKIKTNYISKAIKGPNETDWIKNQSYEAQKIFSALVKLSEIKQEPHPKTIQAWDEPRISALLYLQDVLSGKFKPSHMQ